MARRVFFSFHFERDAWRAGVVRNSGAFKDIDDAGYWDAAEWEALKKKGDTAVQNWINDNLTGTSVTVVLIGYETSSRKWVRYEVKKSHEKGNGLLGIYIHQIKDNEGKTDKKGKNHFGELGTKPNGDSIFFGQLYPTYDWVDDNGYENLGKWIEKAAKEAGK